MEQWTNSNICRTVTDRPFRRSNMSRCMFDPKKKNPCWLMDMMSGTVKMCEILFPMPRTEVKIEKVQKALGRIKKGKQPEPERLKG